MGWYRILKTAVGRMVDMSLAKLAINYVRFEVFTAVTIKNAVF
jgi:hypothetical protein